MLTVSVSVRLASDQAALARTLGKRSSRAARMVFAVSATNMTSCQEKKPESHDRNRQSAAPTRHHQKAAAVAGCCAAAALTHLSQTGEQDEHSQSPNRCSFHLMVLTVGQSQQHGDAHHLRLLLQSDTACQKTPAVGVGLGGLIQFHKTALLTHRKLCECLWRDGGERVAGAHLQFGLLLVLQSAIQGSAEDFRPEHHHLHCNSSLKETSRFFKTKRCLHNA